MRTIQNVEVFPLHLPVIGTFRFSSGSAGLAGEMAQFVLVRLTDSEGETGWGEARPLPQWSYETAESLVTTIRHYLAPAILGQEITDRWGLHRRMHSVIGRGPSTGFPLAKAAIDMAVHDLCARSVALPLRCYLGGSQERSVVELSYTLTTHADETTLEAACEAMRCEVQLAREKGFRHFNFKVAMSPATDVALARVIREAAGPAAFVWADANQGFQPHEAPVVARGLVEAGIDVLEQPFPADQLQLMRRLRCQCPLPLAVDEASVSPADFFHYAAEGLVDYLVVKVTRSAGLWPSLQQIAVATAAGLPLLISGLTDGFLTRLAVCQLAAASGCRGPAALNGSQFIDETLLYPGKAEQEFGGAIHLGVQTGIGVYPDERALEILRVQ